MRERNPVMEGETIEVTQECGHVTVLRNEDFPLSPWFGPEENQRYLARPLWERAENAVRRLQLESCQGCQDEHKAMLKRLRAECEARGSRCFIRFGTPPASGFSWNDKDGQAEAGVSAYRGWRLPGGRYVIDLRGCCFSAMWLWERTAYVIEGMPLDETGSDGEPLLTDVIAKELPGAATVDYVT
jgi:hypothetical protein